MSIKLTKVAYNCRDMWPGLAEKHNICNKIKKSGIKLKINTCLSKLNCNEDFNDFINEVKPDRYKILQMNCSEYDIRNKYNVVSSEEAKEFLHISSADYHYISGIRKKLRPSVFMSEIK